MTVVQSAALVELLDELLEATLDTVELAAAVDDRRWDAHVAYLQALQRIGQETLAREAADGVRVRHRIARAA